jgi:amino acid adenylation domain-containing protein
MLIEYKEAQASRSLTSEHLDCEKNVVSLIESQCGSTPDKIAVTCNGEHYTYSELNERANQVANYLRKRGVGHNTLVGICLERSLHVIVSLLGVLKAGGAYVPLDPEYPEQRLRFMLQDSELKLLVTEEKLAGLCASFHVRTVYLDRDWEEIALESQADLTIPVGGSDLAYVIYTSGSTGQPKGVMIPHTALTNLLLSMAEEPGLQSSDVLVSVTTLSFDIAALELYLPLTVGARLVIAGAGLSREPKRLAFLMEQSEATVMQATPVTWRMLLDSGWSGKRTLKALCGGEALSKDLADRLLNRIGSLWNMYGPTETTIWSTVEQVTKESGPITIGHPIANTQIYILDEQENPVPYGKPGELCIGGAGLARGYWKRAELTRERFITARLIPGHPRLYRTGDEARFLSDGRIECLGRKDNQVKIRGHRIELGEIEAALRTHSCIQDSVVVGRKLGNSESHLVAYFVTAGSKSAPSAKELDLYLRRSLPEYMIPSQIVSLPHLPLTPNGKVDRQALPEPEKGPARDGLPLVPFRTTTEQQLARIFEQILDVEPVGASDSFFELGGDSLLAVRLFSEIEKAFGRNLPITTVFQAPTVEQLANLIMQEPSPSEWSSIVALQPEGAAPPFFCVHSQVSNILSYRQLAGLLGRDQPFYGLQPHALDGQSQPRSRVEDMAADYIREIRKIQPEGPYYLGGKCFGGIVALEMAQQLRRQNQKVALVAMIDSHFPQQPQHFRHTASPSTALGVIDHWLGQVLFSSGKDRWTYLRTRLQNLVRRVGRASAQFMPSRPAQDSVSSSALIQTQRANTIAGQSYSPQSYAGHLVLFWCSDWMFRACQDRRLGWAEIAVNGLEVHVVPGDHISMLEPPHVDVLATKLKACLQKAQSNSHQC